MSFRRCMIGMAAPWLLSLGGCAGLGRPGEGVHAERLSKAGSREALQAYVEANRSWFAQADEYRRKRFCELPAHRAHWECRTFRNDGDEFLDRIEVTGSRIAAADVITNNQEQGVDEGDIVKKLGDRLFVLREGKLHSIDLRVEGRPGLRLADTLVVATDIEDDSTTWYDELLAVDHRLFLLGFNWAAQAAELSLFEVGGDGRLSHQFRYWLSVDDYYAGSNYGARIEGDNLLVSLSMSLQGDASRWPEWQRRDIDDAPWQPLLDPAEVHLPLAVARDPSLHLVLRCPIAGLAEGNLQCRSTGVVGSGHSEFYASSQAAYLSIAEWDDALHYDPRFEEWRVRRDVALRDLAAREYTLVYRIPFDDADALGVARLEGVTGNQFSFVERDGALFVTTERPDEESMRELSLWRIDLDRFADVAEPAGDLVHRIQLGDAHRTLRFTEHALWVGTHSLSLAENEQAIDTQPLYRLPIDGSPIQSIPMAHSVDLVELLPPQVLTSGQDAAGHWRLSLVADRDGVRSADDTLTLGSHQPSEARSHAFNAHRYPQHWSFGMPVVDAQSEDPWSAISDIALFRATQGRLAPPIVVDMQQAANCEEHCYDWYGNARAFFIGERIFALSGGLLRELSANGEVVAGVELR